jgi:hypothetical protein
MHEHRCVRKMGMNLLSVVQYGGNRYIKVHIHNFPNLFIDASGDKDTSHTEVGGESKRCLDDVIRLCRVMQLFQLMHYSRSIYARFFTTAFLDILSFSAQLPEVTCL